jgi:hypothetical protein
MTLYRFAVMVHALAGAVGLVAFWIPVLGKKGGRLHRRAGWVYTVAMSIALVLAVGLVCALLIAPAYTTPGAPAEGVRRFAAFLGILPVLTFSGLWQGIGSLRGFAGGTVSKATLVVLFAGGLVELGLALLWRSPLHAIFGGIAVFSASTSRRPLPATKRGRIAAHLAGMLATGIAAHTAFLVFGAPRLVPALGAGFLGVVLWVLPSALGTLAITWWTRRYQTPVRA